MKALVGCEYSGVVRQALRALGVEAFSCDILPSDDDSPYHLVMDVYDAIYADEWDLIILHPPCTALAVSGNSTYGKGMKKAEQRYDSAQWTEDLWNTACVVCDHVALENPVGVLNTLTDLPRPSYIQPYEHGHLEQKKTGLWLHGLPPLRPTNNVKEEMMKLPIREQQRLHYLPPSPDRWKIRSTTYQGIAKAMSEQWVCYIEELEKAK